MIGLGPFDREDLEESCEKEKNFEKVKLNMVKKHLKQINKYNSEEIENMKIKETKITVKEDIFIYIAMEEIEEVRDLYRRKAEIKRDNVMLRNYVPPQLYSRFAALNSICKQKRLENSNLKTQVRFGTQDLEVMVKLKGSNEPFEKQDHNDFVGEASLPEFDEKIKWRKYQDRKPRR